jgi:hypothetical protein
MKVRPIVEPRRPPWRALSPHHRIEDGFESCRPLIPTSYPRLLHLFSPTQT